MECVSVGGEYLVGELLTPLALCMGDNCRPCELPAVIVSNGVPGVEYDGVPYEVVILAVVMAACVVWCTFGDVVVFSCDCDDVELWFVEGSGCFLLTFSVFDASLCFLDSLISAFLASLSFVSLASCNYKIDINN